MALRRTLLRAADAVVPPEQVVFERVVDAKHAPVLGELARLGIPDLLADGPLTAEEIAARTNTNADAMRRTMRAAIIMGFFERADGGRFTNNRLSNALRAGDVGTTRGFAMYFGSPANLNAWAAFRETLRTGKSAFEQIHGKSVWQWYDEHPEDRETFARAMMEMTLRDAPGIAEAYPFGELKTLCDVGGGRGTLLSEILLHHTSVRAKLCDAAPVLESARELLQQRGVLDRVEFEPTDFFDRVPSGADGYLLKNVLHDWDDERAHAILQTCRKAMSPTSRLIIVDLVMEEESQEFRTFVDLQMMLTLSGGYERNRAQFESLLAKSGFMIKRVLPTPTGISILEAMPG